MSMRLKTIVENLNGVEKLEGKTSLEIKDLSCDSKRVKTGYLFAAIKGSRFNGADFINEAIDKGANAVIVESDSDNTLPLRKGVTYIYVRDAKKALSEASRAFYGDVSGKMRLIGVTGTNGKTTTTYLLESLLKLESKEVGILGTINYRFGSRLIPSVNTTPGVLDLYRMLSNMEKQGIKDCVLEVSSHALEQGRVDTITFDAAIFTNLTSEHLDYHKNIKNYLASKMKLFTKIKKGGWAVINIDDPHSGKIIEKLKKQKSAGLITYGVRKDADLVARDIEFSSLGLRLKLCVNIDSSRLPDLQEKCIEIKSHLIGRYNVYNILASAACGIAMGMHFKDISQGIEKVSTLPGRLEKVDCGQAFSVFVDYAHTEIALESVLKTLRELKPRKLLTVFGCGGDRDRAKRPGMGRVSSELSDKIFITSDNPRSEEPIGIINEIRKGISKENNKYVIEVDRTKAISLALKEAREGDIVLISGKGHETYQVFKNFTLPFDDREVVRRQLCLR